jgi:hypothetical protein
LKDKTQTGNNQRFDLKGTKSLERKGMKIPNQLLEGEGNFLDPLMAEQTGDLYVLDEVATAAYLKQSEADNVKRSEMKQMRSINPAMAIQGLVALAQQGSNTTTAPKEEKASTEEKNENADEVIAKIESIESIEELEAMKTTEKRKGVLKEIEKRIEKLKI